MNGTFGGSLNDFAQFFFCKTKRNQDNAQRFKLLNRNVFTMK